MAALGLTDELRSLGAAVGVVTATGQLRREWFADPILHVRQMLTDPGQRAALLDALDGLLPAEDGAGTADEAWHPLLETDDDGERVSAQLYVTLGRPAVGEAVLGIAGRVRIAPGPGDDFPATDVALRAGLVHAAGDGLESIVGTAAGPLRLDVDVTLDPTGSIGFEGVGVHATLAPLDPGGPRADVDVALRGLRVGGRIEQLTRIDPEQLGSEALAVLTALLQHRLDELAAAVDTPPELAALARHLLPVLGVGDGLPALALERLGSDADILRDWLGRLLTEQLGDGRRAVDVWLEHLAGLLGAPPPSGTGTDQDPWAIRLAPLGPGGGLNLTVATRSAAAAGTQELLLGAELVIDGAGAGARGHAGVVLMALPLSGTAAPRPLPSAAVTLRAPGDPAARLLTTDTLSIGFLQAGLRWDGSRLHPALELVGVEFDGTSYDVVDLSNVDSLRAALAAAARDAAVGALGDTGAGRQLAALIGLVAPADDPDSPLADPARLLTGPMQEIARLHRALLADATRGWRHMVGELGGLLGAGPPVGAGRPDDPWRVALGQAGPVALELAAWSPASADGVAPAIHLGLSARAAIGPVEAAWSAALLVFELPPDAAPHLRLVGDQHARVAVDGPFALPPTLDLALGLDRAEGRVTWEPGRPLRPALLLDGITVTAAGQAVSVPQLTLPPPAGFDASKPDLGLGVPVADLLAAVRALLSRLALAWGGTPGFTLAGLAGLHRNLPGLPADWPLLSPPAGQGLDVLLADPLEALRAWVDALVAGVAADGTPFALHGLAWLRGLLAGVVRDVEAPVLAALDAAPSPGVLAAPELHVPGSGTYDDPWRLALTDAAGAEAVVWLEPDGPPAAWAGALRDLATPAADGATVLQLATRLGPFDRVLRSSLGDLDPEALATTFAAFAAELGAGDGVVGLASQLPDDPAWSVGETLVDAAHHLLPGHPDAIAQILAQVATWTPAATLYVGPPFTDRTAWGALLAAAEAAKPGSTDPAGHFDLRSPPAPEVANLRAVSARAAHYTADLVDGGGDLGSVVAQIAAVVTRIRELHDGAEVALVGHSTAGLAARAFAAANPGLVGGLITLGTPHGPAPLSALRDTGAADAARLAARLLGAGARSGSVADAVRHLAAAAEGWDGGIAGGLATPLRYPLERFGGAESTDTGGVAALALAGRLGEELTTSAAAAIGSVADAAGPRPAPTHVAFGIRAALAGTAAAAGGVTVDAGARIDAFRLPLRPGAPAPARPAHRLDIDVRVRRDGDWLLAPAPDVALQARVRRAELGITLEADAASPAGVRVTPRARLVDASTAGPSVALVELADPGADALLDAVVRELGALQAGATSAAAELLDALDALGLVVRGPDGVPGLSADALGALRADARAFLEPRIAPALARAEGLLGLSGPPGGPWSVAVPGAPLRLGLSAQPWQLSVQTAPEDEGVDLGAGLRLRAQAALALPAVRASIAGRLTLGDAELSWDSADGSLVLAPGPWTEPLRLRPPARGPADLLAPAVVDGMLSGVASAALEAALGPGWRIGSLVALARAPSRWLVSPQALGDGTELDGARVGALLRAIGAAAGLGAADGLALPGGFLLTATGTPCRFTLGTDPPLAIPGPDAGGHLDVELSAVIDRLFHVGAGGRIDVDFPLGGSWGAIGVSFALDGDTASLVVTPRPSTGAALQPIVLLPRFGGFGPILADAAEALLPAVLDALVDALPTPHPPLADAALAVADALGLRGAGTRAEPTFAAAVDQLRALGGPDGLATIVASNAPGAIVAVWQAAGLPGTVTPAATGVTWQDTVAGASTGVTVGWGAGPALAVAVDGLVVGPVRIEHLGGGLAAGVVSGGVRIAVELPEEAERVLGVQLAPELALDVAADAVSLVLSPLGAGTAATLAIGLLPDPSITVAAGGIGALIEAWALPLAAGAILSAVDPAGIELWKDGPTLEEVLTTAGLVAGGHIAVPLPAPAELVLKAVATMAAAGGRLALTDTLALQLVIDGTGAAARLGVGLQGHAGFRTDALAASLRFGEAKPTWIPDEPPALRLLLLEQDSLRLRPSLRLSPVGIRVDGPEGRPLLDTSAVHVGSIAAYAWADVDLDGGVHVDRLGGAVDLGDLGLPFAAATGSAAAPGGGNPVAAGMLGSDGDGGAPAAGDAQTLDPGLGLVATVLPAQSFSLLRVEDGKPVPFDEHPLWFGIHQAFGPLTIEQVGFAFLTQPSKAVEVLVDGGVRIAGLTIEADDLGVIAPIEHLADPSQWRLDLKGLAVALRAGPVGLAGGLVKRTGPVVDYAGIVNVEVAGKGFSAVGAYARPSDAQGAFTSLFVFVALPFVIGGPPYLFVTGLGGGAGYNRRLVVPSEITEVARFPLVTAIDGGLTNDPMQALAGLGDAMPPRRGSLWLAAGVRFTSFALVQTTAVAYVALDRGLEIGILGVSSAQLPDDDTALVSLELALKARFSTAEGVLSIQAQLTDNSWLLSRDCQITGGFAFFVWFREDQFVLTIGGYHPAFNKPAAFPVVPRLGFHWSVSDAVVVKGESYFALTASCVMAGGRLEASYKSGGVYASFAVYADFLISWDPFHYDISAGVSVSAGFRKRICFFACVTIDIHLSLSASVHLLGPPLHGEATLDLEIFSVTVAFGADEEPPPTFLGWEDFRGKFVVAGADDGAALSVSAGAGLVAPDARRAPEHPGASEADAWRFVGDFSLSTETRMPATAFTFAGRDGPPGIAVGQEAVPATFDLAPMNVAAVRARHVVTVTFAADGGAVPPERLARLVVEPAVGHVPAAPWVIRDHPVAAAAVVPALNGLRISGAARAEEGTTYAAVPVTATVSANRFDAPGHGLSADDLVVFEELEGGAGLAEHRLYFVVGPGLSADAFQVSETRGGSPVSPATDVTAGTVRRREQPPLPPIPIGRLIDVSDEVPMGLDGASPEQPRAVAAEVLRATAGAGGPALVETAAALLGPEGAAARAAAGLAPGPLSALATRALRHRRSSPPLIAPLATGLGALPVPLAAPAPRRAAAPAGASPRVQSQPQLSAVLHSSGPATTAAPHTTAREAGRGLPRMRPPVSQAGDRPLRRASRRSAPPPTRGPRRTRTQRASQLGSATGAATRSARAVRRLCGDGLVIPAGTVQVWDLPRVGQDGAFVLAGSAAARVAYLDRAGAPVVDLEAVPGDELRVEVPATASRLVVGCLGLPPAGLEAASGPGAVSRAASVTGRPAACGWQDAGLLTQVAPAALLGRGASLRLAAPLRARATGHRTPHALVPATVALAGQAACETTLPADVDVVLVIADARGPAVPAAGPRVAAQGATLHAPPLVVAAGRRLHLLYAVDAGQPRSALLRVTVAGGEWQPAGVLGLSGRAEDWAADLAAAPPRQLLADGPLTAGGRVTLRHETTRETR